jgi:hypothetical protein
MKRIATLIVLALLSVPASAERPARNIRVVLDLSKSMKKNDASRLAILSTILLHDLACANTTTGDSFEVIPFDLDWRWPDPAAPPPVSTQRRIAAKTGKRQDFVQAVQALPYEANMTYFYPGIAAALGDLERPGGGQDDVRAIVLVTDGVPERPTRDAELQRIRDELAPRLEQHGIRLYVLAFGGEAASNRDFFAQMVHTRQGASLGESFVDPNGTQLLDYMLQLFARSFGFSPDAALTLPGASTLDLERNMTPERVAVAVLSPRPQAPTLRLAPPQGGNVSAPDAIQSASVPGGSYSLVWVLLPKAGQYGFSSDAIPGTVAVLRPTRLALEILPAPPHKQTARALAGTRFPLRVLVRPASGAQGDPGPVDLSFRMFGERVRPAGTADSSYAWESDRMPPTGAGTPSAQGRIFDIVAEFREDPEKPGQVYAGHLEVEVRRGEAIVGALKGMSAHRIEIHPFLSIAPLPLTAYVSNRALERREQACTNFSLQLNGGHLPHPERPQYPVRAVLSLSDPAVLQRELRQASFTLDGLALEIDGQPGSQPAAWSKGRLLAPTHLLGKHEICVRMGKPSAGNPGQPIELNVMTTLLDDPYDEFHVIEPFQLKVPVAPPTAFERWRFVVIPALFLLGLVALLWYLRDRPVLPGDLRYAIAREATATDLAGRTLQESAAASLLGWAAESSVLAPGEDRLLGRVRPADQELFQFRPASGVRVEAMHGDEPTPLSRGLATLAVHRTYRLRTDRGSYLFRMEYQ